jgi:NADH dehydrogenase
MGNKLVTVFGGSGFLGRHIIESLVDQGARVRVAVRHPERATFPGSFADGGQFKAVYADVRDETSTALALSGSDAVINAVSLYVERGDETFEAVHVEGARHVARQSSIAAVERLVHISGIGSDATSQSRYVRARAHGEAAVIQVFDGAIVLRPSVLFGPGDVFFSLLAKMAERMPLLPLFGDGRAKLQPVYVGDVAKAVTKVLAEPTSAGQLYELGGPKTYTYRALLQLVSRQIGRRSLLLPVPFLIWEILAGVMSLFPSPPLTRDQITLMKRDNVADRGALGFADLDIEPTAVEDVVPAYLG